MLDLKPRLVAHHFPHIHQHQTISIADLSSEIIDLILELVYNEGADSCQQSRTLP
jgi:hypothetical protein